MRKSFGVLVTALSLLLLSGQIRAVDGDGVQEFACWQMVLRCLDARYLLPGCDSILRRCTAA